MSETSSAPLSTASSAPRLPLRVQLGYAYADLGVNVVEVVARLYLLIFYTDVVGLRPSLAGLAVALGLVWDAVTDPVMGVVSDRLRHRFGGRRFFVLVGSFFLGAGIVLLFSPPPLATQGARFAWLLGAYVFLNSGLTVMAIPHTAMSGELTQDTHGRSVLFGWRFAFANVGALLAAALPVLLSAKPANEAGSGGAGGIDALPQFAWITALLIVLGGMSVWFSTRGIAPPPLASVPRLQWRAFLAPLANPSFRPLVAGYVVAMLGVGVNAAVALYYYGRHLELGDRQIQTLLVTFLAVWTLSLLFWVWISRRVGKLRPLARGATLLGGAICVLYLVLPPGNFVLPLVLGCVGIGFLFGCTLLIDSLLTDVIDVDRLRTGEQRSGIYFGFWRFAAKLARAVSLLTTGLVLDLVGFDPELPPTEELRWALRLLFGPGVGCFFLVAGLTLLRYRFTDAKQRQARRILERRDRRLEAARARA
jgi:GPH family glycoside/pentoside/hexuronide:cation symporter